MAVDGEAGAIRVACEGAETTELTGSHLLTATGRTPNTDDLGVEHLDLDLDDRGHVPVDGRLQTSADGVWALGDLRGGDMFTHTARDDADVARGFIKFVADATTDRIMGCHIIGPDAGRPVISNG